MKIYSITNPIYTYFNNNKETKFQALFFVHPFFFFVPLTTEQWRISFVRIYIYNMC
jgi:hypothetical protein